MILSMEILERKACDESVRGNLVGPCLRDSCLVDLRVEVESEGLALVLRLQLTLELGGFHVDQKCGSSLVRIEHNSNNVRDS